MGLASAIFEEQARRSPDAPAVVHAGETIGYAALQRRALGVARRLWALGVAPESRVGICFERSIDAMAALLGVLAAGGAYVPLDPAHPPRRIARLIADAEVGVVLTRGSERARLPGDGVLGDGVVVVEIDDGVEAPAGVTGAREAKARDLGYVMFTSGSTGAPKGVLIEQGSLAAFIEAQAPLFGVGPGSRVLQAASLGFDASVSEMWMAWRAGAALHIASGDARLPGPEMARMLRESAITHAVLTPSVLAELPCEALPALSAIVAVGEVCPPELAARWGEGRRFFNGYGPTESTVYTTVHEHVRGERRVPIGRPIAGRRVVVGDASGHAIGDGEAGEIWVGGVGLARGYAGRADLTAERFIADPGEVLPGERLYRTGDLGRVRGDGSLEFLGRADEQVKIRGQRVELGEIEALLMRAPSVRAAAVVLREDEPGRKRIVAYVVPAGGEGPEAWRRALGAELPVGFVPAAFVVMDALPRGENGKVDRAALPAPARDRSGMSRELVAPRTATERGIARIWEDVLGVTPVGVEDGFFELGGDSLLLARVVARAAEAFAARVSLGDLFETLTVAGFAGRVDAARGGAGPIVARDVDGGGAPLSFAQERLWFLHHVAPESGAYNVPALLRLRGALDVGALGQALSALVARHEALRTRFGGGAEGLLVVVDPAAPIEVKVEELGRPLDAFAREEAARPFDLGRGPLFRARLVRVGEDDHALMLSMHHAVSDGWSLGVLVRDLAELYGALVDGREARLAALPVSYGDYAGWQRAWFARGGLDGAVAFFREELEGAPNRTELPAMRARPAEARFAGATYLAPLGEGLETALAGFCRVRGVTPFMALFTAFCALLHRLTDADDVVVGTPVAGRGRREIEDAVGFFASTVPLRARMDGDPTFGELLDRTRARVVATLSHAEVPFDKLVEALRPERDPSYRPLVQVMFALQEAPAPVRAAGVSIELDDVETGGAPFDLLFQVWMGRGRATVSVIYDTDLFDEGVVARIARDFEAILGAAVTAPERRLSELVLVSDEERRRRAALASIEATLLADPAVDDAAVSMRVVGVEREIVAYVVAPRGSSAISARLPEDVGAIAIVPVGAVPRDAKGRPDERLLRAVPVVDEGLLGRIESSLRALPGVVDAVVVAEAPAGRALLHITDLLPEELVSSESPRDTVVASLPPASHAQPTARRPPAYRDGGPLSLAEDMPRVLSAALAQAAEGDRGVTVVSAAGVSRFVAYRALLDDARRVLAGLLRLGLGPGDRVILQIGSLADHFAAFWGAVLGGMAPAAVAVAPTYESPNGVTAKLYNTWELLGRPPIIAGERLVQPILGLGAHHPMPGARVLAIEALREHEPSEWTHAAHPSDVAFLQLTSGSTGIPKCIQITHAGVMHHVAGVALATGYRDDDVSLNWLPFDHVVPILTCHLKDVVLGTRQIHVETERVLADPLVWLDLLEEHRATHSWAPNFGYKLARDAIAAAPSRRWDLSAMRRFMNAGEQVTERVVGAFLRAAEPFGVRAAAMQPAFGMAEACTCMTYANDFDPARDVHRVARSAAGGALEFGRVEDSAGTSFVDLGPPIPGVEIRIADADAQVVPEGTIGRLQIRGAVVTPGYLHNEAANREAFVGDGWFNSGDLGFMLEGRLTLTGREKETIIVRGANHYCHEIEDVVSGVPGVTPTFAAACAIEDARQGTEGLAIFFVPVAEDVQARARVAEAVRSEVAARAGVSPQVVVPIDRDAFPKTTSGKIQRGALSRALREGRFGAVLKEIDLALEGPRTMPDWFHRAVFRRRELGGGSPTVAGRAVVVVMDRAGLGERLVDALRAGGARVIAVDGGAGSAAISDAVASAGEALDHVVHLASYGGAVPVGVGAEELRAGLERAGGDGVFGLLAVVRALISHGRAVRLTVVSSRAQSILEREAVACEKAPLLGLVRTIPQESPEIDARHVDLAGEDLEAEVRALAGELGAARRDREVAYRRGERWALGVERVDLVGAVARRSPFVAGGAYLITGGLGGIGTRLCERLLADLGARVIIIGRTPLGASGARAASFAALEAAASESGGDVRYEAVDVAEAAAVAGAVERAEGRWGKTIDGVVHLAGTLEARLLADETDASFGAAIQARARGCASVVALLERRPGAAFIAFSSVNGLFGGFSVGAYAAACRYVEHVGEALVSAGREGVHVIAWSQWDDVGMSRANPMGDLSRSRGYHAIPPAKGIHALHAALQRGPARLFVGLDGASPHVLRQAHGAGAAAPRALAFVVAREGTVVAPAVRDRFGVAAGAEIRRVERIHRRADGSADVSALRGTRSDRPRAAAIPPRDDVERSVAQVWQELLRIDRVGVHDTFFSLGGHSMLLAQARVRLQRTFDREISIVELFRHPTVATLSAHLRDPAPLSGAAPVVHDRAARQRAAMAAQRQRAPGVKKVHG